MLVFEGVVQLDVMHLSRLPPGRHYHKPLVAAGVLILAPDATHEMALDLSRLTPGRHYHKPLVAAGDLILAPDATQEMALDL